MRLSRLNVRVDNKYHKKLPETGVEFLVNYMIAWTLTLSESRLKENLLFLKREFSSPGVNHGWPTAIRG